MRALFVLLVVINTPLLAGEKITQKVPTWLLSPSAIAQIAKEVDGGWFSMRPPKKYLRAELDTTAYEKSGIKIAAWTMESDHAINSAMTIMSLPVPNVPTKNDRELFDGILKS